MNLICSIRRGRSSFLPNSCKVSLDPGDSRHEPYPNILHSSLCRSNTKQPNILIWNTSASRSQGNVRCLESRRGIAREDAPGVETFYLLLPRHSQMIPCCQLISWRVNIYPRCPHFFIPQEFRRGFLSVWSCNQWCNFWSRLEVVSFTYVDLLRLE
jgi:hypothetical protein